MFSIDLAQNDNFVVIGSDGIWEFLSNQEVAEIAVPFYEKEMAENASSAIVNEAYKRWHMHENYIDDITCIVIFFKYIINFNYV